MFSNNYDEIVAHYCTEYTPINISSYISFRARSCNDCSNNIYGVCVRNQYENIKASVENN